MKFDNYCIALIILVLFCVYVDNKNNVEGYDEFGSELSMGDGLLNRGGEVVGNQGSLRGHALQGGGEGNGPIGQAPKKMVMKPPVSMAPSLGAMAPAKMDSYMLLDGSEKDKAGVRSVDSQIPTAYPRVGGVGNLGQGSAPTVASPVASAKPTPPSAKAAGGKSLEIVMVYAPWCGWSKKALPDFDKLMNEFNGKQMNGWNVSVVKYNSDEATGKAKAKEFGVKGFPSIFVIVNGSRESGPRSYDELSAIIKSKTA